jgi:hypothetical protein
MIAIHIWSLNPYYTVQSQPTKHRSLYPQQGGSQTPDAFQGGVVLWQFSSWWLWFAGDQWPCNRNRFLGGTCHIVWAYLLGLDFREYPNNVWPYMVQYLQIRILKFTLRRWLEQAYIKNHKNPLAWYKNNGCSITTKSPWCPSSHWIPRSSWKMGESPWIQWMMVCHGFMVSREVINWRIQSRCRSSPFLLVKSCRESPTLLLGPAWRERPPDLVSKGFWMLNMSY